MKERKKIQLLKLHRKNHYKIRFITLIFSYNVNILAW